MTIYIFLLYIYSIVYKCIKQLKIIKARQTKLKKWKYNINKIIINIDARLYGVV